GCEPRRRRPQDERGRSKTSDDQPGEGRQRPRRVGRKIAPLAEPMNQEPSQPRARDQEMAEWQKHGPKRQGDHRRASGTCDAGLTTLRARKRSGVAVSKWNTHEPAIFAFCMWKTLTAPTSSLSPVSTFSTCRCRNAAP